MNVPKRLEQSDVKESLKDFGKISHIYFFKRYNKTLKIIKEIARLKRDNTSLKVKKAGLSEKFVKKREWEIERNRKKLKDLNDILKRKRKKNEVFSVFVTFEHPASKIKLMRVSPFTFIFPLYFKFPLTIFPLYFKFPLTNLTP
jgi:superfamily II RNA helicase